MQQHLLDRRRSPSPIHLHQVRRLGAPDHKHPHQRDRLRRHVACRAPRLYRTGRTPPGGLRCLGVPHAMWIIETRHAPARPEPRALRSSGVASADVAPPHRVFQVEDIEGVIPARCEDAGGFARVPPGRMIWPSIRHARGTRSPARSAVAPRPDRRRPAQRLASAWIAASWKLALRPMRSSARLDTPAHAHREEERSPSRSSISS